MNAYAKVRAPKSSQSQSVSDKAEPKQTEISLHIKQPFKISRTGIEQPKMRVNHAPSVVHIIERKANKMEQSKISSALSERIHVIGPSSAKKAWRFNLNQDFQDQSGGSNVKEEKSSQKVGVPMPQEKIQAPIVNLPQKQESISDRKGRMTYQRRLERAVSQSVSENSKKSSRSVLEESSVHLDFGQPIKVENIQIQEVVEIYRNSDKKSLQRSLARSEQSLMVIQDSEGKVRDIFIPEDCQENGKESRVGNQIRRMWIVEDKDKINEIINQKQEIFLGQDYQQGNSRTQFFNHKRLMTHSHVQDEEKEMKVQGSLPQRPLSQSVHLNSIEEQLQDDRPSLRQVRKLVIVEDQTGSHQIFIPKEIQQIMHEFHQPSLQQPLSQSIHLSSVQEGLHDEKRSSKLQRRLLILQDKDGRQEIFVPQQVQSYDRDQNFQQIFLPEQIQALGQQKSFPNHKRFISSSQPFEKKPERVAYAQAVPQEINIQSLHENWQDGNRSSKYLRKIVLVQDNRNRSQDIFLPEEIQQSRQGATSINHIRNLGHSLKTSNRLPQGQNIDLYSLQERLSDSNRSSKNVRNLLIKEGRVGEQQIFISQEYQDHPKRASAVNQRRSLVSSDRFSQKQEKIASRPVPDLPEEQKIDLSSVFQQIQPRKAGPIHSRKLLVLQEKNGRVVSQQINVSSQLEELVVQQINIDDELKHSLKSKALMSHKRTVMKSEKVQSSPQVQSVQIGSIEEMWGHNAKNSKLSRRLLVLQNQKGQVLAQQIAIPQQLQQSHNRSDVSSHKRELRLMKMPQGSKQQSKNFSQLDLQAQDYEYSPQSSSKFKMARNLLLIKEESGKEIYQQVIIPEDFEVKQAKISNIHYKRQIASDYRPGVEKQQKINGGLPPSNEIQYEQVVIPSDLEEKSSQRFVQSHKRTVRHFQALPQAKRQSKDIIEEPVAHQPLQIQQIIEDYSSKSKKSKQARNLLVIQQPNGKMLTQEIIIPEDFSQSRHQKQPKLEHKRQFKIITFEEESNINQQMPVSNQEIVPSYDIPINPLEESYRSSQKSQKTSRNLLAIQNSNGETLYQQIFLPDVEESNQGNSLVNSHKRQFKIVTVEEPQPQQQQYKPKSALLLARNQEGKVVSQQIQIPDQHDQMAQNQRPSITHQRNIRPQDKLPPRAPSINIPEETQVKNAERDPISYKRQIKPSQLKTGQGVPSNSPQVSQEVHPEKSFNPSTLNSSQAQNLHFNASLEQSRASPDCKPLTRSLAPCPEKLSQSELSNDPHERLFDVYNPRAFLDGKLLASQMSLPTPTRNVDRPLKPHRRPGFF